MNYFVNAIQPPFMPSPPAGGTKPRNTPNSDPDRNPKNNPNPKTNFTTNPVTDTEPASASPTITIRISPLTQERLDSVKHSPEESYDTVISRLCDRLIDDEPLSEETLKTIEKSLEELRNGIFYTHEGIVQELIERTEKCEPEEKSMGKIRGAVRFHPSKPS